ncbi:MAG: IS66 family insertion sequence element accessory protein TnpB [Mycobacterium sp.]
MTACFRQAAPPGTPLPVHLFLFLNRRRDAVKMLLWEPDGLVTRAAAPPTPMPTPSPGPVAPLGGAHHTRSF